MFVAFKKVKIMSENIPQIQSLLDSVSEIIKKHENMALLTGEKYNVFDIIGIKNREVTLHSAMLGNLLNAKGSHGMKGKFLELFQNVLDEKVRGHNENVNKIYDKSDSSEDSKDKNEEILVEIIYSRQFISEEDCNNTKMEIEKSIGKKNEDEGGRIDLYISKGENAIIIENKIYAEEQYNQLIRYFNYNDKAAIVFLTLYGDKPNSTKDNKGNNISNKVICLSYKEDIIKWLELCMKEVYDKPLILYSLKQYQNLIKIITNQSINKVMSKEIKDLILKNENFSSYIESYKLYEQIKNDLIESFFSDDNQLSSIIKDLNLNESNHQKRNSDNIKFYQNFFTNEFLKEKGIAIGFIFNNGGKKYNNLVFTIRKIQKKSEIEKEKEMVEIFKKVFPNFKYGNNEDWNVIYADFTGSYMWDDNFGGHGKKILNGEMKILFKEKLEKMLKVIYETYSIQY